MSLASAVTGSGRCGDGIETHGDCGGLCDAASSVDGLQPEGADALENLLIDDIGEEDDVEGHERQEDQVHHPLAACFMLPRRPAFHRREPGPPPRGAACGEPGPAPGAEPAAGDSA